MSIDETGNRYGRLLVLKDSGQRCHRQVMWLCLCNCGRETEIVGCSLRARKTTSCGCFQKEKVAVRATTHGMTGTSTYISWQDMKRRCGASSSSASEATRRNYYDKGIRVCNRWLNSFEAFLEDMGRKPEGYTLDRLNGEKDYDPENCRWASVKQQAQNRINNKLTENDVRKIKILCDKGKTRRQLATQFNVHPSTISNIALGKYWSNVRGDSNVS